MVFIQKAMHRVLYTLAMHLLKYPGKFKYLGAYRFLSFLQNKIQQFWTSKVKCGGKCRVNPRKIVIVWVDSIFTWFKSDWFSP